MDKEEYLYDAGDVGTRGDRQRIGEKTDYQQQSGLIKLVSAEAAGRTVNIQLHSSEWAEPFAATVTPGRAEA